jgi:hypothetical protein
LAIDSRNRHLLLCVAAGVNPWAYAAISFIRLTLPDIFFYRLGSDYGHRGIGWIERQTNGQTGYLGWVQRWYGKLAPVLLVVMPNTYVLLFAGMDRTRRSTVIALDAIGTMGRLAIFWWAGRRFASQLRDVLDFVQRYQWFLVAALVIVSVIQAARQSPSTSD